MAKRDLTFEFSDRGGLQTQGGLRNNVKNQFLTPSDYSQEFLTDPFCARSAGRPERLEDGGTGVSPLIGSGEAVPRNLLCAKSACIDTAGTAMPPSCRPSQRGSKILDSAFHGFAAVVGKSQSSINLRSRGGVSHARPRRFRRWGGCFGSGAPSRVRRGFFPRRR